MSKPYSENRYTPPFGGIYPIPIGDYVIGSDDDGFAGSRPEVVDQHIFGMGRAAYATLLPLTRGLLADPDAAAAVDSATNEWLAERWLSAHNQHGRYLGSIRVTPRSPKKAVLEIQRWADHPAFVQVAIPLEAHLTYGDQLYFPIWQEAARHDLPVVVHSDHAAGVLRAPTVLGYPTSYLELYSQVSLYAVAHLVSLIAHGVFDRIPRLVFIFADGGFDYFQTLMWRVDKDWRSTRTEVPWVADPPSSYLRRNVRFILHRSDGLQDAEALNEFIDLNDLEPCLLYGSNYPHWDYLPASEMEAELSGSRRESIMAGNARELYGLT